MAEDTGKKTEEREVELLAKACKAYEIAPEFVLGSKVLPDGEVVIVTHGGAKVRWRQGDKVAPLDQIRVDGVIRKKMTPITGDKKAKKK